MKNFFFLSILATALISSAFAQGGTLLNSSSSDSKFICGESQITDYDGNKYNTVQIGKQCWMKENLRTTCYSDGTPIPLYANPVSDHPVRYLPNNNEQAVATHGYLYNWVAATRKYFGSAFNGTNDPQGICPTGWHIPSDDEWTQLTDYVSSQSEYLCGGFKKSIAKALADSTGWSKSTFKCTVGFRQKDNNATGFSAVPAGNFVSFDQYSWFYEHAYFWTGTQQDKNTAFLRSIHYDSESVYGSFSIINKEAGCSVRCVKN